MIHMEGFIINSDIAALTSYRINLSPFTKGCRDEGASMRIQTNFLRGSAPTKSVKRHVQCVALHSLAFGITSDIFFKLVLKNVD